MMYWVQKQKKLEMTFRTTGTTSDTKAIGKFVKLCQAELYIGGIVHFNWDITSGFMTSVNYTQTNCERNQHVEMNSDHRT